jgi:hypothetical protein
MDHVLVELIVLKVVLALFELELVGRDELQVGASPPAYGAIAGERLGRGIDFDGVANGAAMATALVSGDRHTLSLLHLVIRGRTRA